MLDLSEFKGWQRVSDDRYEAEISSELGEAGKILVSRGPYDQWQASAFGVTRLPADSAESAKLFARRLAAQHLEFALARGNRFDIREYPQQVLRAALGKVAQLKP